MYALTPSHRVGRRNMIDWKGILRELRLLAKELSPWRFFAIWLLVPLCVVAYLASLAVLYVIR